MKKSLLLALPLLLFSLLLSAPARAEGPVHPVKMLHSDASGLSFQLDFDAYRLISDQVAGVACQRVAFGDMESPVRPVLLGAPPEAVVSVTMQPLATEPIALSGPLCSDLEKGAMALAAEENNGVRVLDMGFMRSQRIVRLEIPALHLDPATGQRVFVRQMRVAVAFEEGQAGAYVAEPDSYEAIFKELLVNGEEAKHFRLQPSVIPPETAPWTPPSPAWRILVDAPGMYEISYQALRDAGLPVDSLDPRTLKLYNFGKETPITVTGEADSRLDPTDSLLFYGHGVDTRYTSVNVYWLTYGNGSGSRISDRQSASPATPATSYQAAIESEENFFYVSSLPMSSGHDHWFGRRLMVNGPNVSKSLNYLFDVTALAPGAHQAQLSLMIGGNTAGRHHLRVYVNDHKIHDDAWEDRTLYKTTINFAQNYLRSGQNTVRVEFINDTPNQYVDQIYVDWLHLNYQRKFLAEHDTLFFNNLSGQARTFQIDDFTSSQLEVFDITDPFAVQRITGWQANDVGGGHYRLKFNDVGAPDRHYWAQAVSQRLHPLAIQQKTPGKTPLTSHQNGADYLVIAHPDFLDALKPLLDHRTAQGLRVMAVSTQDIYDEFGYGMMSAEAIHDFLAYAYANWQSPAPSLVLLVGDGTYDMRHYQSNSADTYVPPYLAMVDLTMGETATDNRFVTVAGNDILPDMHIGRLPANTPAETTAMVNKILAYEQTPVNAPWTQNVLFVTDNLIGGGGNFYDLSDAIADGYIDPPANTIKLIPERYHRTKLYLDRTCNSGNDCQSKMANTLNNDGALFVSYIGHGAKTFWAQENIWNVTAVSKMQNGAKLPVMLPMTCNEGYFVDPSKGFESTSEAGVRLANNGAIASWAPTGYGLSSGHDYLERGLLLSMFHGFGQKLGPATTAGKLYLVNTAPSNSYFDLIDTFLLMGDPALALPVEAVAPKHQLFLPTVVKE